MRGARYSERCAMTKRHRHRIILPRYLTLLPPLTLLYVTRTSRKKKKKRERWFTFTLNQLWFIFDNIYRAGDYRSRRIGAQQTLTQIWKRQINQLRTISRSNRLEITLFYTTTKSQLCGDIWRNRYFILFYYFFKSSARLFERIRGRLSGVTNKRHSCTERKSQHAAVSQPNVKFGCLISSSAIGQLFSLSRFKRKKLILDLNHEKDNEYYNSLISLMRKSSPPPPLASGMNEKRKRKNEKLM